MFLLLLGTTFTFALVRRISEPTIGGGSWRPHVRRAGFAIAILAPLAIIGDLAEPSLRAMVSAAQPPLETEGSLSEKLTQSIEHTMMPNRTIEAAGVVGTTISFVVGYRGCVVAKLASSTRSGRRAGDRCDRRRRHIAQDRRLDRMALSRRSEPRRGGIVRDRIRAIWLFAGVSRRFAGVSALALSAGQRAFGASSFALGGSAASAPIVLGALAGIALITAVILLRSSRARPPVATG